MITKYIPRKVWMQGVNPEVWFTRNRKSDIKTPRVIILGLGRAGTTFIMQILTRLGYDTGGEPYNEPINPTGRAGFEIGIINNGMVNKKILRRCPEIIKNPYLTIHIDEILTNNYVPIRAIICPIREVMETIVSRERADLFFFTEHRNMPAEERVPNMFSLLGKVMESCTLFDVPFTTIAFPRLAKDKKYLYNKLKEVFADLDYKEFSKVYDKTVNFKNIQTRLNKSNYGR